MTYKDIGVDLCKPKGGWGWSRRLKRWTVSSNYEVVTVNREGGDCWKKDRESRWFYKILSIALEYHFTPMIITV